MRNEKHEVFIKAIRHSAAGRFEEALTLMTRALELGLRSSVVYRERALVLVELGRPEEAINDLAVAIEGSEDGKAYAIAGRAYLMLDRHEIALRRFDRAIELDSKNSDTFAYRSLSKSGLEDSDGAFEDAQEALDRDPKSALAYYARASAQLGREDFDAAVRDYTSAIRRGLDTAAAFLFRGVAHAFAGRDPLALSDLAEAVRRNPADPEPALLHAVLLFQRGSWIAALRAMKRIRRQFPELYGYALAWTWIILAHRQGADAATRQIRRRMRRHDPLVALLTGSHAESELVHSGMSSPELAQFRFFKAMKDGASAEEFESLARENLPFLAELVAAAEFAK